MNDTIKNIAKDILQINIANIAIHGESSKM